MRFDVITLFPEMIENVLGESIIGRARKSGAIELYSHQLRDYEQGQASPRRRYSVRRRQGDAYFCGTRMRLSCRGFEQGAGNENEDCLYVSSGETFLRKKKLKSLLNMTVWL